MSVNLRETAISSAIISAPAIPLGLFGILGDESISGSQADRITYCLAEFGTEDVVDPVTDLCLTAESSAQPEINGSHFSSRDFPEGTPISEVAVAGVVYAKDADHLEWQDSLDGLTITGLVCGLMIGATIARARRVINKQKVANSKLLQHIHSAGVIQLWPHTPTDH